MRKAFDSLPRTWRDAVAQTTSLAKKGELHVLKLVSRADEPLKLQARDAMSVATLVAYDSDFDRMQAICCCWSRC